MLARVARYEVPRERVADAVAAFGEAAEQVEQLVGCAGGYVLVDHEDGRTMTLTLWENHAVMDGSERDARKLRNEAAASVDGSVLSVEKFEVVKQLASRPDGV